MILPPFNTLRAQVIRRGDSPEIMGSDVQVRFNIPGTRTRPTRRTSGPLRAALRRRVPAGYRRRGHASVGRDAPRGCGSLGDGHPADTAR